jgi:ribonuclease P/MRP protein subunit RPP1
MGFWDYCVREDADIRETARMAEKLGLSGICVLGKGDANPAQAKHKAEVATGLLVEEKNPDLMRKHVRKNRKSCEMIAVAGNDDMMNRIAAETPEVDILLPAAGTKIDVVMAKAARKNSVRIGFEFGLLLHSTLQERGRLFSQMMLNAQSVRKFGAPFVIVSGAQSEFGLRSPSELIAFGKVLGFDESMIKKGLSPGMIRENRKRLSGKWVMPGVEVEK